MTRHFYWRQLRDMKGSAVVEAMTPVGLTSTPASAAGRWRGRTPGPVTRSPSPAYLGGDDAFDQSITDFSERYADQNEQDFEQFIKGVRAGRLEAVEGT